MLSPETLTSLPSLASLFVICAQMPELSAQRESNEIQGDNWQDQACFRADYRFILDIVTRGKNPDRDFATHLEATMHWKDALKDAADTYMAIWTECALNVALHDQWAANAAEDRRGNKSKARKRGTPKPTSVVLAPSSLKDNAKAMWGIEVSMPALDDHIQWYSTPATKSAKKGRKEKKSNEFVDEDEGTGDEEREDKGRKKAEGKGGKKGGGKGGKRGRGNAGKKRDDKGRKGGEDEGDKTDGEDDKESEEDMEIDKGEDKGRRKGAGKGGKKNEGNAAKQGKGEGGSEDKGEETGKDKGEEVEEDGDEELEEGDDKLSEEEDKESEGDDMELDEDMDFDDYADYV